MQDRSADKGVSRVNIVTAEPSIPEGIDSSEHAALLPRVESSGKGPVAKGPKSFRKSYYNFPGVANSNSRSYLGF